MIAQTMLFQYLLCVHFAATQCIEHVEDFLFLNYDKLFDDASVSLSPRAICSSAGCAPGWLRCPNIPGGCCPTGVACLISNTTQLPYCDLRCTSADVICGDGGCCPSGMVCDTAGHSCQLPNATASTATSASLVGNLMHYAY